MLAADYSASSCNNLQDNLCLTSGMQDCVVRRNYLTKKLTAIRRLSALGGS